MWYIASILLILWVIYDFITGEVWSYYKIKKSEEPLKYWFFMFIWTVMSTASLYLASWY